ncbi:MAG: V-type ATP synthase subunit E, partial [Clostridia bacterium]|nr:V-type ATP synthase subunit E [Clostridia bacterium]
IVRAIEGWAGKPDAEELSIILTSADLNALEETVLAGLKAKMLEGVTLKANDNFDGGFRIAVNNGAAYYDYSTEAVVEMLSNYLSPKVTALLKEAE